MILGKCSGVFDNRSASNLAKIYSVAGIYKKSEILHHPVFAYFFLDLLDNFLFLTLFFLLPISNFLPRGKFKCGDDKANFWDKKCKIAFFGQKIEI